MLNDKSKAAGLFSAHLINDMHFGVVPAIIPLLSITKHEPYAIAGLIVAAYQFTSSLLQPFFGLLYDKFKRSIQLAVGVLMSGFFISILGYLETVSQVIIACVLAGLGSAIFHPAATSLASINETKRRGTYVSIFMIGGNLGLAIGPLIVLLFTIYIGQNFMLFMYIPAVVISIILLLLVKDYRYESSDMTSFSVESSLSSNLHRFSALISASTLRSLCMVSLQTFLPVFIARTLSEPINSSIYLTLLLLSGAAGMFIAGLLADKFRRSYIAALPLMMSAPLIPLLARSNSFFSVMIILIGFLLSASHPIMVVISHELSPSRLGLASSLIYGFSFGVAALILPFIGLLTDIHGFYESLSMLSIMSFLAGLLVMYTSPKH